MTSVRLPVVPDAERPELYGWLGRRPLMPIPNPEATQAPPVWGRTKSCLSGSHLSALEDAVLEAADIYRRDVADIESRGLPPPSWAMRLIEAVDALRASRNERKAGSE